MKTKFPHDVQFLEEIPLLIHRPRGLLNEATVNKILRIIGDLESSMKEPFNRFFDTVEAEGVELNFQYMIHISLYRRLSYAGRPPIKSAILATDKTMVHYAKLHALITQGSPSWLGVPLALLARKRADGETP
jgi:hypothetical protein